MLNPSYVGVRADIISLLPEKLKKVLDVGCSNGTLGEQIKYLKPITIVWGLELDPVMGNEAKGKLDKIIIANAESYLLGNNINELFDCIIFADILEHLYDPWQVLKKAADLLAEDGTIIISLPNIRYYKTFTNLFLRGSWKYEERGIFDRTHLRFFARKDIYQLISDAGLKITRLERNFRLIDKKSVFNKASKFLNLPLIREYFTFQYLIQAKKL